MVEQSCLRCVVYGGEGRVISRPVVLSFLVTHLCSLQGVPTALYSHSPEILVVLCPEQQFFIKALPCLVCYVVVFVVALMILDEDTN
jgi:hypothetical protein